MADLFTPFLEYITVVKFRPPVKKTKKLRKFDGNSFLNPNFAVRFDPNIWIAILDFLQVWLGGNFGIPYASKGKGTSRDIGASPDYMVSDMERQMGVPLQANSNVLQPERAEQLSHDLGQPFDQEMSFQIII